MRYKLVRPLVSCEQCLTFTSYVKEWITIPENLDSEQRARLWEHRLEIETLFFSRLNFFLIFESVLLAVVGALYSKTGQSTLVLKVIVILGFCITDVWLYIQDRNRQVYAVLDKRAYDNLPEYKVTRDLFGKGRWPLRVQTPAIMLLTYAVPVLIALVWTFLFLFFWFHNHLKRLESVRASFTFVYPR
jgi:hypothetical protein